MQANPSSQVAYSERLIRLIVPLITAVILVAAFGTIVSTAVTGVARVRALHTAALERAALDLKNYLVPLLSEINSIAENSSIKSFINGTIDSREASATARNFISQYPTDVLSVRYINNDGFVKMEVLNSRGFPQITVDTELALRSATYRGNPYFNRAINSELTGAVLSNITLQRDRRNGLLITPPRAVVSVFVPVLYTANQIRGAIQVELDTQDLFNVVNRAEVNFIDPLEGRHVLLTVGSNLVVADNTSATLQYLADIELPSGNLDADEIYAAIAPFLRLPRSEAFIAQPEGLRVISSRVIDFPQFDINNATFRVFIVDEVLSVYRSEIITTVFVSLLSVFVGVLSGLSLRWLVTNILDPVERATDAVIKIADSATSSQALALELPPSPLADSVRRVASQLQTLNAQYEEQVARRNRDLRIVGRIGYETATLTDLDGMMKRAINLICNEMGFYHAQVFIVDEIANVARLAYSRGEAGAEMLGRNHQLPIGSPTVIGTTTALRRPVVLNDVSDPNNEVKHGFNPLLPETRGEMALPLIVGDKLLGALDIQSKNVNAFLPQDLPTFELLAYQVAIAIYNTQLRTQSERRIQQIDRLNRQLTRSAWEDVSEGVQLASQYGDAPKDAQASAPIAIRGEVIGEIAVALPEGSLTEGDQAILQAVAERVAIAIENARLFQETQTSLAETSTLYALSRELNESNTLEDVLRSIVEAVANDANGAQLWLFDDAEVLTGERTFVRLAVDLPLSSKRQTTPLPPDAALTMADYPFLKEINSQKATLLGDLQEVQDNVFFRLFSALGAMSLAIVPLNMRGAWKGFVTIEFPTVRAFGEREQRIYDALVGQAGVAVDNRLLLQQTEEALTRNEKLYAASRLINTARGLSDLVYAAVATASDNLLNFWLGLLEGEADITGWRNEIRIVAYSEGGNVLESAQVLPLIIDSQSPLRIREPEVTVDDDPTQAATTPALQRLRQAEQRFMAIFPLYVDNMPIALFYMVSKEPRELSQEDFDVYKALTGQMSTQIQNRRLLERTEAALNETTRLYVASRAISSAQDMNTLYETLAGHAAAPFAQATASAPTHITLSILLARPEPSPSAPELEYVYQWSSDPTVRAALRLGTTLSQSDVPLGYMLEQSDENVLVYSQVRQVENLALRSLLRQDSAVAAVVTPLQVRQQWFGVMIIHANRASVITDSYVRFLQALSDQVAVAIENQTLLQENIYERANLTNILSTLPAGVLVLDPETFLPRQGNDRMEELLGRKVALDVPFTSEAYGLYRNETTTYYPDDNLPFRTAQQLNRPMFVDDVTVINGDLQIDLLINAAPIYDSRGKVTAIVTAFQDITNLRSLENTLQQNLRETVALYETQRALSESETLDDLLDTILLQMEIQQIGSPIIWVTGRADDQNTDVVTLARHTIPMEDEDILRMFLLETPFFIDNVAESDLDEKTKKRLLNSGVRSLLVAPMRAKARNVPLGWLMLVDERAHAFDADNERVVSTIADMASTAIDNNYLVQSTQNALQETAALYTASTTIHRASNLEELSEAVEGSLATLDPDMYAAYLVTPDGAIETLFNSGFEQSLAEGLDIRGLLDIPIRDQSGIYIADLTRNSLGLLERLLLTAGNITTLAIVNLRVKDIPNARILLGYQTHRVLSEADIRFLTTVSDSASVVIDNTLLLAQIQSSLRETNTLYQASRALTEASSPQDIVGVIADFLIDDSVDQVLLFTLNRPRWDSVAAQATIAAVWSLGFNTNLLGREFSPDLFGAWQQLATETVIAISDIQNSRQVDDRARNALFELGARSAAFLPLRVPSRAIGVIMLSRSATGYFQDRDLRVYQAFAEQASLSLEAGRLLRQTERRATQLETTTQIAQRVGQILDLDELFSQAVNLIRDQFGYDHVQVFLMDEKDDWAVLRASTGEAGRQLLAIKHALQKGSRSVIGQVTATGEVTVALDTADAKVVHRPNPYLPNTRSELAIPLIIKDRVVGALDVQSNRPNAFEEEDIQALTALAAQIAIAIDNARLYEEAQSRASDLAFLFDVTNAAASANTLEETLQSIAERIADALEPLAVAIYLPQTLADLQNNRKVRMHPVTLIGSGQPISELSDVWVGDGENLIGIVASTLQSQIVPNVEREVRYTPINAQAASAIIVPISSGSELVGVVAVEAQAENAFNHDTLTLLLTLAGSLAAVVQNTLLVERLQQSNEQLREIDRLKSQFLANMSHELRTPLNSIIGFSRVMLKGIGGPLTEMQEQDLTTIYNSGNHLLSLINDILDQAKIEANELTLKSAPFDVKPMVENVKSIAIGLMKDKPLQLFVEIAPNLPQAYADETRTRQILLNLVSNAIKFTPEGSVTIRIYTVQEGDQTFIRADVVDTGIGIAQKDMSILFEQFRQVDNSLTRTAGGTGLGLPISKSLAELQGGSLIVESEVGKGSIFSVLVPTQPQDAVERQQREREKQRESKTTDTAVINRKDLMRDATQVMGAIPVMPVKRDVLLIEDNKDMVDQFRRALQREGFEVQTADHPSYAEAMVGQLRPTVVVMDVNFANGQGWDILARLKQRDDTAEIPIIVTTLNGERERALSLGAYSFLQRPFMPDALVATVLKAEKEHTLERILIIDDQPEAIRLLKQLLSVHGNYRVYEAESGKEGISLVARRRPSLIILDLRMPDMDGFEVLSELRANPETASIPVMVVTGDVDLAQGEQDQLKNIRVVPKTSISEETYNAFLNDVKATLTTRNR
jgi:GAF domain-containing protein/DNA-binding response OmpR family regulator